MNATRTGLAAAVLLSLAFTSAPARDAGQPDSAQRSQSIRALAAMPDADAKVTAALLAQTVPSQRSRVQPLLDRASTLAPSAADIALLDITVCAASRGCDVRTRSARLDHRAPDNAAFLMADLHDASVRRDSARIDAIVSKMAAMRTFDLYFTPLRQRLTQALQRIPRITTTASPAPSAKAAASVEAMAMLAAVAIPAFQDVAGACKPTPMHALKSQRRRDCRQLAEAFKQGDTMLANNLGWRLQQWSARNDDDRAQAIAQQRMLSWQAYEVAALATSGAMPIDRHIALMAAHPRETDAVQAILKRAGKPLEPPADWHAKKMNRSTSMTERQPAAY